VNLVDADFPRKPRVLVVDDSELNRDLLAAYLNHMDADVVTAADGAQALELALKDPPDLVLTDMQMPRMDGLDLVRQLKANPLTQFVPVVMITAMEGDEEKLRAVEAGVDDFMNKPFSSVLLMTRARTLLKTKHLSDQLQDRNRLLRQMLYRYVSQDVADLILNDPERHLELGGSTRRVTVLFADIRGFTRYTERHTAGEVVETLNLVFSALTQLVFKPRGTFDKYLGDSIMAFYGAPYSAPDDALRALRTALEMQAVFAGLQADGQDGSRLGELGLGVSLHSGEATVGNVGSETVMDYTVIGDTVNVAHRLQAEARAGEVLISAATYDLVQDHVRAEPLGEHDIRGRAETVAVYRVLGLLAAAPNPQPDGV
jgi:class 3 adenylate cyclase